MSLGAFARGYASKHTRWPARVPGKVGADPWTLFCVECAQKMRITTAAPALEGRETRIYGCACGHSERISVVLGGGFRT
jgi:hypothetical protein